MTVLIYVMLYLIIGFVSMSVSVYLLNRCFPKYWLLEMQKEVFLLAVITWPIQLFVMIFELSFGLCFWMSKKYTDWICRK